MVGEAFPADLLGAAAFAHGVDQLNPIRVDDAEHGRRGQEGPRPVLMGLQKTKEPRPLGQAGDQRPIVACQPAIEGPVADAFEGMQQPQGEHLTGPEVGLGMFGDRAQLLIDLIEQRRDKIHGDHGLLRSSPGCTLSTSVEEVHAHDNKASTHYYSYWFVSDNPIGDVCYIGSGRRAREPLSPRRSAPSAALPGPHLPRGASAREPAATRAVPDPQFPGRGRPLSPAPGRGRPRAFPGGDARPEKYTFPRIKW